MSNLHQPRITRPRDASLGAKVGLIAAAFSLALISAYFVVFAPILLALFVAVAVGISILIGGGWWARRNGEGDRALSWDLFLFWILAINLPIYTRFDAQGIVRPDLLNPQSIGRIVLTMVVALGFVANGLLRRRISSRDVGVVRLPWKGILPLLLLFGWYTVDTAIVVRHSYTSLMLALFRVFEWVLYIALIVRMINRYVSIAPEADPRAMFRFALPQCAFPVFLAAIMAVLVPPLAFNPGESGVYRLQTPFTHSNVLGILAGAVFFYALEMKPKWHRLAMLVAILVLAATYSRGAWLGFMAALLVWGVLKIKPGIPRVLAGCIVCLGLLTAYVGRDAVLDAAATLLARSRDNAEDVISVSQRNVVWRYSTLLINQAPWVGHGYVVGPKKLLDIMAEGETGSYFRAPHAHNEFVQAQINGGIPATALTAIIYLQLLWLVWKLRKSRWSSLARCATAWTVLCLAHGMLTPLTSERLMLPATLVVFLYVWSRYMSAALKVELTASKPQSFKQGFHKSLGTQRA